MRWTYKLSLRLRSLFRKTRVERELSDELRYHLEKLTEEKVARGMAPEEARYAALREWGGVEQIKEECRDMRRVNYVENFLQDVRYGLRQLRRNPGFTAVAVLTLALGIGANTAIFSVVNAVVLRPLPYPHSDRLMWIAEYIPAFKVQVVGGGDYVDWKEQNKTLEQMAAYDDSASFNLTGRGTPERIHAAQVSASFFATLDVGPQLGRGFTSEEDQPNGPKAVILMHPFWQQYFGSDAGVLGQTVTLDGTPYSIVGVMPASFKFPGEPEAQLLLPLQLNEANERLRFQQRLVRVLGRLRPSITVARVASDLDAIRKRANAAALPAPGPGIMRGSPMAPPIGPGSGTMMGFNNQPAPPPQTAAGMGVRRPPDESAAGPGVTPQPGVVTRGPEAREGPLNPHGAVPTRRTDQGGSPTSASSRPAPSKWRTPPDTEMKVVPLAEHLAGNLRPEMLTMLGVVALVLLIACANVANLTLARASARAREVAVRAALGAKRWRLVRQLLTESVVLALGGGAAGLVLAIWGVGAMMRLIPSALGGDILNLAPPRADWTVLLFALAVSILTGILFGLAPAIAATRLDLVECLKDGVQALGSSAGRHWLRGALAVAELSLALVLLIGAGLLIKSFYRVLTVDPGFAPERVLTMNLSLTHSRYPSAQQKTEFFSQLLRRVESLPGVRSAAIGDSLPLNPYHLRLMVTPPWLVPAPGSPPGSNVVQMSRMAVSPSYFYTLGIPLLKGRTFTDSDNEQAPKVAVINEALSPRLWPGQDPIGKELPLPMTAPNQQMKVIGVVGNSHHEGLGQNVESEIYVPFLQSPQGAMQLALRTAVDPTSLSSAVRREVAGIDPEQPIYNMTTLEQTLSDSVAPRRFNTLMLGIFAAIALALSTVGIYGVIAYSVTQRTHEMGIRMALGATRQDVLKLVVGQGFKLTLVGIGIGILGAIGLTRFLSSLLYGVKPTDPPTFIAVSLILTAVALLACFIPARRATKVDPMVALRYE